MDWSTIDIGGKSRVKENDNGVGENCKPEAFNIDREKMGVKKKWSENRTMINLNGGGDTGSAECGKLMVFGDYASYC